MDTLFCYASWKTGNIHFTRIVHSNILATLITDKEKWDKRYASCSADDLTPAEVLVNNQHLLPDKGTALDLACGHGANALLLAEHGLNVSAWDISSTALNHLALVAKEKKLSIKTEIKDVTGNELLPDSFDVVVVSHFLVRDLIPEIRAAINPNGLIFYQTFIKDKTDNIGPTNPDYLLDKNELLFFFNDWRMLVYREEGAIGNIKLGFRNQAILVAQKP